MKLRIFTVFHRTIDERLIFQPFSRAEIDEYFSLYAVSDRYPLKTVNRLDGSSFLVAASNQKVIRESALKVYEPALQARGFMEASCYIHVLKNELYAPFDYIGVAQYDMSWTPAAAAILRGLTAESSGESRRSYALLCGKIADSAGQFEPAAFADRMNWEFLLASYNRFFDRQWTAEIFKDAPLTLFQTYLLPRAQYVALASWLAVLCEEVYPWAMEPPYATHWGALSGYIERAEAVFMAARLQEGATELHHLPLDHDDTIPVKLGIKKEHYGD